MIKDNEKVYDEQIAPLMTQIIKICKENEIPVFATFAYAPDPEDLEMNMHCTTSIPFGVKEIEECRKVVYKPSPLFAFLSITT